MCAASSGVACVPGSLLVAHGANNLYENGYYLLTLKPTTGYVKKAYEQAAHVVGYNSSAGDVVYSGVDLGLSAYGVSRLILQPDQFRLFRYIGSDFISGWQDMGNGARIMEILGGGATVISTLPQAQTAGKEK
jgi:hypothetical protein